PSTSTTQSLPTSHQCHKSQTPDLLQNLPHQNSTQNFNSLPPTSLSHELTQIPPSSQKPDPECNSTPQNQDTTQTIHHHHHMTRNPTGRGARSRHGMSLFSRSSQLTPSEAGTVAHTATSREYNLRENRRPPGISHPHVH
ncbi:hypothetical protein KC19_12G060300, partial [Ceratodon purpureus]